MRGDLAALVKDIGLTTIGLGVAFGYALLTFGSGVGYFIDGLVTHLPSSDSSDYSGGGLSWQVGHHLVNFDQMLIGAVELAVVLTAAYYVRRAGRPDVELER